MNLVAQIRTFAVFLACLLGLAGGASVATDPARGQTPGRSEETGKDGPAKRQIKFAIHAVHRTISAQEARTRGVPSGYVVLPPLHANSSDELVLAVAALDGSAVSEVSTQPNSLDGTTAILVTFNAAGAKLFADLTAEHQGFRLAIVVDGRIVSAPTVRSPIRGGSAVVTGSFNDEQAKGLVQMMTSGP